MSEETQTIEDVVQDRFERHITDLLHEHISRSCGKSCEITHLNLEGITPKIANSIVVNCYRDLNLNHLNRLQKMFKTHDIEIDGGNIPMGLSWICITINHADIEWAQKEVTEKVLEDTLQYFKDKRKQENTKKTTK